MSAYFEINPVFRHASYNIQAAVLRIKLRQLDNYIDKMKQRAMKKDLSKFQSQKLADAIAERKRELPVVEDLVLSNFQFPANAGFPSPAEAETVRIKEAKRLKRMLIFILSPISEMASTAILGNFFPTNDIFFVFKLKI